MSTTTSAETPTQNPTTLSDKLSSSNKEKVTIQLKWFHQLQFAGYYAAIEKGFYSKEGLEVELRQLDRATSHIDDVLQGKAQYGVDNAGLLLERLRGKPVVLLAQVFQHSPLIFLTREDSGIRTAKDMEGKRVNLGHRSTSLMALLLDTFGEIDAVKIVPNTFNNQDLIDDKIDVYAAYITNQPDWFRQHNVAVNIINPRDYGIDFYGDNLFTTEQELSKHPERVEKIRRATLKGWRYALDNREEIIDLILEKYNPQGHSRDHLAYEARETEKLIAPDFIEIGSFKPAHYQKMAKTYARAGFIKQTTLDPGFFYQPKTIPIELTKEEKAWLKENPVIRLGNSVDWPPFGFLDNDGVYSGIAADYFKTIEELLNIKIEPAKLNSWKETVNAARKGEVDLLDAVVPTPQRREFLSFTKPYLSYPVVIFTHKNIPYIGNMSELNGQRVAVIAGSALHDILLNNHSDFEILPIENAREGMLEVEKGNAIAFIGNLSTASHVISTEGITDLKVAGETPYRYNLTIGVNKNKPILASVLQKALDAIPQNKKDAIYNDWFSIKYQHEFDYQLLTKVIGGFLTLMILLLAWNGHIHRQRKAIQLAKLDVEKAKEDADRANRVKSNFLANMSHELRTPLNAVQGYAQILLNDQTLTDKQRKGLTTIYEGGQHLVTLIEDILSFSKMESKKIKLSLSAVLLQPFLDSIVNIIKPKTKANVNIVCNIEKLVPETVEIDEKRLRQVLLNLLSNAVKFTTEGHIDLNVALCDLVDDDKEYQCLRFSVEDTGLGINQENVEEIFQPFVQVDVSGQSGEGTGLGLSISQQLVKVMGGKINVESIPDNGSRFWFELKLPVTNEKVVTTENLFMQPEGYKGEQKYLLIVDDMQTNREVLYDILTDKGFKVSAVSSGPEALKLVDNKIPDMVLTDLVMPIMNGFELKLALREITEMKGIPIVAISANIADEEKVWEAGFDDFIPKPVNQKQLFHVIKNKLGLEWEETISEEMSKAQSLTAPETEELESLRQLVVQGRIRRVVDWTDELESSKPECSAFAAQVRELAEGLDESKILTLIDSFKD